MNKRLILLMAAALALLSVAAQVTFTNVGKYPVIEVTPERTTGLDMIYVVFDTQGVGMTVNSMTGEPAKWESYYYSNGNLVMEPVPDLRWNGMATTLEKIIPNVGYKIQDGNNRPYYCWVVNYADYYLELNDMFFSDDHPCSLLTIKVDGYGPEIPYYTTDGHHKVLDREIKLYYNTLVWENDSIWEQKEMIETFESLDEDIMLDPPLCDTEFRMFGDRFLEQWDQELVEGIMDASYYKTKAVNCSAKAYIIGNDGEKEKLEGELTGGSAPVHIVFTGYPTDAAIYSVWEMATDSEFENVILQYNQNEVDYTFIDAGTYYMRYTVANADGTCEYTSETFSINVSESEVGSGPRGDIPNVFSPGTRDEINDIWKVPNKSIVEFHCWIYNRWGTLLYEFTDPNGGWDGTYKGRLVDTGVYYYVVTATGSDGVKYKKRGDINILQYKKGAEGTSNYGGGM